MGPARNDGEGGVSIGVFFDGWDGPVRVLVVGGMAYAVLILMLRTTGKRTLSKMNAFDLIVTVALGSTLATVLLSRDVALAEGMTAFALLCGLQFVVTWLSVRSPWFQGMIKAQPVLLVYRGRFLRGALVAERVTEDEVLAALRGQGRPGLSGVEAVVLETDGSLSVVGTGAGAKSALGPVGGWLEVTSAADENGGREAPRS